MTAMHAAAQEAEASAWKWDFKDEGDTLGWAIPENYTGRVMGNALWLTIATKDFFKDDPGPWSWPRLYPTTDGRNRDEYHTIDSPAGLG